MFYFIFYFTCNASVLVLLPVIWLWGCLPLNGIKLPFLCPMPYVMLPSNLEHGLLFPGGAFCVFGNKLHCQQYLLTLYIYIVCLH